MARKLSKRMKAALEKVVPGKQYAIADALQLAKECASVKFKEGIDIALNLGIDARKSDQAVRGATVLPNGTGRDVRVAVFAQGENAKKATAAGADIVGFDDLAEDIQKGNINFDVLIATPDSMRVIGKLGQILGPKGLMPNPKVGTVSADVAGAVKNAKAGQVSYRTDKNGIIHCSIGKAEFDAKALQQNLEALIADIKKAKPASAKGTYLKKLTLSSTMGPGIAVDVSSVS